MKILIDLDTLQDEGVISPELAKRLSAHAVRDSGSTAINLLLAFGGVVLAAGLVAMIQMNASPDYVWHVAAIFGLLFLGAGFFVQKTYREQWSKLGSIWLVIGALVLALSVAGLINKPFPSALAAAAILAVVGVAAESRLLVALIPLAIISAIGGSTEYWSACYTIIIQEATLTIVLFTGLGLIGWEMAKRLNRARHAMALTFTRICVILVNFGFWIGSLWGDYPGALWFYGEETYKVYDAANTLPHIPSGVFALGWAAALVTAGMWGAKNGRRFLVNTVAVFGAIHFYTQWFERLGANPVTVMIAGAATIAIGLALWKYNKKQLEPVGEITPLT